jgi:drug/metabolite transporter (DMT)-like permease
MARARAAGVAALVAATLLWGSSFPAIKVVVGEVGELAYTWMRGLLALAILSPYVAYRAARGGVDRDTVKGGLAAGVAYTLGLWLQGWGTGLTTASNSAFLTAVHMVWVHAYVAAAWRLYSPRLASSLAMALAGVLLLTKPHASLNPGDILVLLSSFMWAAQVLIVDRYSRGDPLVFTAAQITPSLAFAVPDALRGGIEPPSAEAAALLLYLAAGPGVAAFALQVYGQRYVNPAASTIIYQLEPVSAAALSAVTLGERMDALQLAGAGLILASIAAAEKGKEAALSRSTPGNSRPP